MDENSANRIRELLLKARDAEQLAEAYGEQAARLIRESLNPPVETCHAARYNAERAPPTTRHTAIALSASRASDDGSTGLTRGRRGPPLAKIENLISRVADEEIRQALELEVKKLKKTKRFGLVFEEHIPEYILTPGLPPRPGALALVEGGDNLWTIRSVGSDGVVCERRTNGATEEDDFPTSSITVVKRFGDPVYPGLRLVESVTRGDDRPHHLIIEAENYHALQLLQYTHQDRVDLVYLDPPFNTGATSWKYNNDFVDSNDAWRHSKWLAFMKRRLALAKRLLKKKGVLVVAIDENEHATLVLLLKEIFRGYDITSVAVVHNPRGIQGDNFSYSNEFAVFVIPKGEKLIAKRLLEEEEQSATQFRKWGNDSERATAANCFYPVFVSFEEGNQDGQIVG